MKLYIDDRRPAPDGWIQAFNITDAIGTIEANYEDITHISFDYYLSEEMPSHTGVRLIEYLIQLEKSDNINIFHQPFENYTFHSSDRYMNDVMRDVLYARFGFKPDNIKAKPVSQLQRLRKSSGRR